MSIIGKACLKEGVELVADTPPKGKRGVKAFQRLIAAMRAAEAEVMDRQAEAERALNESLNQNLTLQETVHRLQIELAQLRLQKQLDGCQSLTVADRKSILSISA